MTFSPVSKLDCSRIKYYVKRKLWCILCVSVVFCCWILLYVTWDHEDIQTFYLHSKQVNTTTNSKSEFLIHQTGCRIPSMSVLGPLVADYMKETIRPLICEHRTNKKKNRGMQNWFPAIVTDHNNSLSIAKSALKYYNKETIHCTYRSFHRPNSSGEIDDDVAYSDSISPLHDTRPILINSESSEFVKVMCKDQDEEPFYQDYFAFVPPKKHVEKRCKRFDRQINTDRINVMVLGIDALSRLNFHRQMPQSAKYLKENLEAIEMLGFNKIGDNTFPNLVPTLTGLSVTRLKKTCWPSNKEVFDKCPFIWKTFQDNGFRTVLAEDTPFIGVFNYFKRGFHNQPTDYYLRPFYAEAERHIGHQKPLNCYLCVGARPSISVILNYALKHFQTWKDNKRFFGFFWTTSFTHDYFNLPPQGDLAVLKFLKEFKKSRQSNSTILILMSDHGIRWGSFRETYQGHLEERLPMLIYVLPKWFQHKYQKATQNLRNNAEMLTTHYDLYETLVDITNLERIQNTQIKAKVNALNNDTKGRSLFLPISSSRSCKQAGIPKTYCTCHDDVQKLQADDEQSMSAAKILIDHINGLLKHNPECATLRIQSIEQASVERSTMGGKSELLGMVSFFMITVKAFPGNGLFEGMVRYNHDLHIYRVIGEALNNILHI